MITPRKADLTFLDALIRHGSLEDPALSIMRSVRDELEWLRVRTAVADGTAPDAEDAAWRLRRVHDLHPELPGVDDEPRCGTCATPFPCPTVIAVRGMPW